jgi:hypothetical protein
VTNLSRSLGGVLLTAVLTQAATGTVHTFKKLQLSDEFWCEGADVGDFNHDGKMDVAGGPFWWAGPDFKVRHEFRDASRTSMVRQPDGTEITFPGYKGAKGHENDYSDNFFTFVADVNHDGWDDLLIIGLPSTELRLYLNPQGRKATDGSEHWPISNVFKVVDNESPMWVDLTGDGKPELICNSDGYLGYIAPNWSAPTEPWLFHRISPQGKWHKYTHGIGHGDINGDGKPDLLEQDGWWEQPKTLVGDPQWTFHAFPFAPGTGTAGGAQMYAYDFNGDGLNDVFTTLDPHGYGLVWYEQSREAGVIKFRQHVIMGREPKDSPHGIKFTQAHAIALVDMDGDGVKDVVTGKRFWAHGPTGDPESNEPAVLYWFQTVRRPDNSADFVPHLIDNDSGVGTEVVSKDLNGDGRPDIVVGNKKGVFVFLHQARQ